MQRLVIATAVIGVVLAGCFRGPEAPAYRTTTPAAPPVRLPEPPAKPPAKPAGAKAAVDASWYQPRSSWAATQIRLADTDPMTKPWRITVHHSGNPGDDDGDPKSMLRNFERNHQDKGWAAIGYHFIIAKDGRVFEGRPLKYQGAHATGENNLGNIGVCLMGDFDSSQVPKAQRVALIDALDRLSKQYGIKRQNVYGHRDFKTTECPGRNLYRLVEKFQRGE